MVSKEKFAEEMPRITVFGRHIQVTHAMKEYALEKFAKIEKITSHISELFVTLDVQKLDFTVSILMKFEHFLVKVSAHSTDMYVSIDKAFEKLQAKIRKWKEKIQNHHAKGISAVDMKVNVLKKPSSEVEEINEAIEEANEKTKEEELKWHSITSSEHITLKMLTQDEAIMKMELSENPFLIFKGEEDLKIKVIYRLQDGNYGVVSPS